MSSSPRRNIFIMPFWPLDPTAFRSKPLNHKRLSRGSPAVSPPAADGCGDRLLFLAIVILNSPDLLCKFASQNGTGGRQAAVPTKGSE
jgi:hypothetical protein